MKNRICRPERAVALFRMRAVLEDGLDELTGLRPDGLPPVNQTRGGPFQMLAMRLRHVLGESRVTPRSEVGRTTVDGHSLPLVEDLQAV